jgi:integrase
VSSATLRRSKLDYESRTFGLDRNELGALVVQVCWAQLEALITLLALNGLRISEALGADIDDLDYHRTSRSVEEFEREHHG